MNLLTIAITGGTGFIGSALIKSFIDDGHSIVALHRRQNIELLGNHKNIKWVTWFEFLKILRNNRHDAVINLANIYESALIVSDIIDVNIKMPIQVIENSIAGGSRLFINTDTFFSKPGFNYSHMQSYIESKIELLKWLRMVTLEMNHIKVVNARLEHVFGPGDNNNKFVPYIMNKLTSNEDIDITPGEQERDFIHVDDVVEAFKIIVYSSNYINKGITEFEVGTGVTTTIKDFIKIAREVSNSKSIINIGALPYREREIMKSFANNKELQKLGWVAKIGLRNGLLRTLQDKIL